MSRDSDPTAIARTSDATVRRLVAAARLQPKHPVRLEDRATDDTGGLARPADGEDPLEGTRGATAEYQSRLSAEGTRSVLLIFQGMDGAGKDSAIKHVLTGLNPQGIRVTAFRAPGGVETDHDFLWRHNQALPRRGQIGVFNRSHYEETLVVRVHPELLTAERLPPELKGDGLWKSRFRQINDWERYLTENGTTVVKFFLHLSWAEQRERFLARIDKPQKNWKFSEADMKERDRWTAYQAAFEEMVNATTTPWAPWYVVPADHKWFTRLTIRAVLFETLRALDPAYPTAPEGHRTRLAGIHAALEAQTAPPGEREG